MIQITLHHYRLGVSLRRLAKCRVFCFNLIEGQHSLVRNQNLFSSDGAHFHLMGSSFSLNRAPFSFQTLTHMWCG